jgi:hypothetical protein
MTDRDVYLARRARELRADAEDAVREPLARVQAGPRAIALTLGLGRHDPWLELGVWSPQGPPRERRVVERGRVNMLLREVDELIAKLTEARARLASEGRR